MENEWLLDIEVDEYLRWCPGTTRRLAKKKVIPFKILPDGERRFDLNEILAMVEHVHPGTQASTSSQSQIN